MRIKGFGGCGHMAPVVLAAILVGLVERARGKFAGNRFVQLNARTLCKAVAGEDGKSVREYDFKAMVIANIYIYIFAVFHDNRRASNSKCIYPVSD